MPHDPEVLPEHLYSELKEWRIFCDKGKLKKKNDPIWEDIKKALKLKMSSASLYLYVYKNEHSLKDRLQKHLKIKNKEPTKTMKQNDTPTSTNVYTANYRALSFDISMPINQVIDSWTDKKKSKGWTDVLKLAIWDSQKLPCAYNFKNSYITEEQFKVSGSCSDCKCDISCEGELIDAENIKF